MQAVITEKQAREITGGRKPLVPVEYEAACRALAECRNIDEAKYWSDKADALAAWAKIYKSNQADMEARRLKLHAYRRMGELAIEIAGPTAHKVGRPKDGASGGARSVLMGRGLSHNQAKSTMFVATMPEPAFQEAISRPSPPSPLTLVNRPRGATDAWLTLNGVRGMQGFYQFCNAHSAVDLAPALSHEEAIKARHMVTTILEWLDEFDQRLPKA